MNVLPGFENLQPKAILGFDDMGFALIRSGDSIQRYKLFVGPGGAVHARLHVESPTPLPDQLQETPARVRQRNYDQM